MKKISVAINGFGRIGRAFFKLAAEHEELDILVINDLGDVENLAYLLKYDTAYGASNLDIKTGERKLIVNGKEITFISEKDVTKLPWKEHGIDVVVESTGIFESFEKAKVHLEAGAKRVVLTAPSKEDSPEGVTVLVGINDDALKTCQISSNASCTTNAGSPLIQILHETIGIEKALLNTVHGYTATQSLVDSPTKGKDMRRGRAAAHNIVPSTTGAAIAVTKAIPDLAGAFDGIAIRVPVVSGSIVDVTFISKRETSKEEVNDLLTKAAADARWKNIFTVTNEQLVSSDIVGTRFASIADLNFTRVVGGNLVKVLAWYDNEMGYAATLVEHVVKTGRYATSA